MQWEKTPSVIIGKDYGVVFVRRHIKGESGYKNNFIKLIKDGYSKMAVSNADYYGGIDGMFYISVVRAGSDSGLFV